MFCIFRAKPVAYGGSQARGWIRTTAASPHHNHSNARSEPRLRPNHSSQQCWIHNPLSKARDWTRKLLVPSWIHLNPNSILFGDCANLLITCGKISLEHVPKSVIPRTKSILNGQLSFLLVIVLIYIPINGRWVLVSLHPYWHLILYRITLCIDWRGHKIKEISRNIINCYSGLMVLRNVSFYTDLGLYSTKKNQN